MNHSDDDIFGRNIDQLDRETPRFNLSEEEDNHGGAVDNSLNKSQTEKKMSVSSQKPPSVASVQPYTRASTQPQLLSPHPKKKTSLVPKSDLPPSIPSSTPPFYNQRFGGNSGSNNFQNTKMNGFQAQNPAALVNMKMSRQMTDAKPQLHTHPGNIPSQNISQPLTMDGNSQICVPVGNMPQPLHCESNPPMNPPYMNQKLNPAVMRVTEQCSPCYCPDCLHTPAMPQQLVINSERQKIEDEILLRQRELDSCWQEDELDCPRDFTAIDRKKEKFYAQRACHDKFQRAPNEVHSKTQGWHQEESGDLAKDALLNRETKSSVDATSSYPTAVSRNPQVANAPAPGVSMTAPIKAKAQAVVSPLPRSIGQKKVNINTVVSRFSYSNEPENPQDYASSGWPHSEMGSRIPSSERINLSPLCLSAVPSGIQTPVEPGTGQKQLQADLPSSSVPRATQLQQLPGHDKKKTNILDKFKGNEQYKRSSSFAQTQMDSVKDFTSSKWPQSEMGSRIPSSERISLSPLTMSGAPSAVQSGIQTPLEPNTGAIPLKSLLKRSDSALPPNCPHNAVEKHDPIDDNHGATQQETQGQQDDGDCIKDFSKVPQSELTSRVPSSERICLSPLCQSGIPSGCQTPHEDSEPEPIVNENGVTLRARKPKSAADTKLEEVMSRMNIGDNPAGVPRFDDIEEDSVKDFAQPEVFSRMQSYEHLNFTPPWSSSTSGIVTPSDLASLFGGIKPLRDQPLIEENEEEIIDLNHNREVSTAKKVESKDDQALQDDKHASPEDMSRQHVSLNKPASEMENCVKSTKNVLPTNSHHPVGVHPPIVDNVFNGEQDHKQHYREVQKVEQQKMQPVEVIKSSDMCNQGHDINHHSRSSQLAPPSGLGNRNRCNSWSSVESNGSNRTDISTVVNAPTSMHNTAPGSPDPNGSEASDSDLSDGENDDNDAHLSDSFSQTESPHLPTKRRPNTGHHHMNQHIQVNQQQYQQQHRWPHHGDRRMIDAPKNVTQHPYGDDCCNNHSNICENKKKICSPQDDQVKSLIKMAKEKFSMKPPVPNGCPDLPNDQSRSPQIHMDRRYIAQQQQRMIPPSGGGYYPQHMEPQGGVFYDKHHPEESAQRFHPHPHDSNLKSNYHNYQHQNAPYPPPHIHKQAATNEMQQPYPSSHGAQRHPPHPHSRPPHMQSIPESKPPPVLHAHSNHIQPSDLTKKPLNHGHQGVPGNFMPYPPRPMMNPQQVNHIPQFYGKPMNIRHGCPPTQDTEHPPNHYSPSCQQRSYSITSLEPNHPSPPHTDALDTVSVVSFASMAASNQNLDTKADMMSSLLSMLGTHDPDDMARTLLAMSSSPDSCAAMRQSGCIPLLIQLLHNQNYDNGRINWGARQRAGLALHKIVHSNEGDRRAKREMRVLRLLEIIRTHSEAILSKDDENYRANRAAPPLRDHGPGPAVAAIMKLSFEEEHKNTICELGGLQTIGEVLAVDYMANKECNDPYAIALRKYAGMVLINLTYNDSKNKAVLCSMTNTLKAIIGQLSLTYEEDIIQVFAGIIRNISWRPDENTQRALQSINAVRALMTCVQNLRAEVCFRAVLSAVWNLSAHNSENKEEICRTTGSLKFLAFALRFQSPAKSLVVVENAGGILRNVSSHIAVNSEYRKIIHQEGCLKTLVSQLRSTSTRVVSNACGVLWNLSARCIEDQELLWELGAVSELKLLINSKHKSISASSASALRNLLAVKPGSSGTDTESHASFHHRSLSLPSKVSRRTDKKYRSVGRELGSSQESESKGRFKVKNYRNKHGESHSTYFDLYKEPPVRSKTQNIIGGPIADDENHSNNTDLSPASSFCLPKAQDVANHSSLANRIYASSSSCSSFSLKDKHHFRKPYSPTNFMSQIECEKDISSEKEMHEMTTFIPREECNLGSELKPYDDCKMSVVKDSVCIFQGTPKVPNKSIFTKKPKLYSGKLSMKLKKNSFKKSADSIGSSKDSLAEKSEAEKVSEKKKDRDDKRENVWIKTKALKEKLLNRSHSSDLAFDKALSNETGSKKSPFEFYSMSNFPDRVASDQCLSLTDKHIRDDLMNGRAEMHHGSWSSCECKEERIYPPNHLDFLQHTPQSMRRDNHVEMPHQQFNKYSDANSPIDHSHYSNQRHNEIPYSFSYPSNMACSTNQYIPETANGSIHGVHSADANSEVDKKSKFKKSSILKNPLKKVNDPNKISRGKRSDKKSKKKFEEVQ